MDFLLKVSNNVKFSSNVIKLLSKSLHSVNLLLHLLCNYEYLKPTTMRKIAIIAVLLVSTLTFAQNKAPKLEEVNGLVKATYYFDNGQIQQEGFFKDGKLDGKWISYDVNGNKKAIAEYNNGQKTGKWFFWNDKSLSEVDYSNSAVAAVKTWNKEVIADKN